MEDAKILIKIIRVSKSGFCLDNKKKKLNIFQPCIFSVDSEKYNRNKPDWND